RTPISIEDHQQSRLIADPIRLLDCCMETDGSCAVIVTTPERARDLNQPPVHILGAVMGAGFRWPAMTTNQNMRADEYGSAGQRALAERLYAEAGITPADADVALLYDHFTPMVLI